MSEDKTYQGGCHCGRVRYEVETNLTKAYACNCSICEKKGYLLVFAPADKFKLLTGEASLTDYQFNKRNVHHLFCSVCGIQSFGWGTAKDGAKMYSVNARCLDDIDVSALSVTMVDGKNL